MAGLSGWLAQFFARETVFLFGLIIPAISALGVLLIRSETTERRPIDWRILGGGIGFLVVLAVALGGLPFAQEFIFVLSMLVICTMLFFVTRELDAEDPARHPVHQHHHLRIPRHAIRRGRLFLVDARRAQVRRGLLWHLRQTAAIIAIVAMWIFSKQLTEYSVTKVLFWLAVAGAILSLPNIGLFFGLHHWTEETFGFGARTIAVIDAAAASPFAQLSMIPLLTLIAFYAPAGHRATWFALMASLMNMALVAGQLQTKYLNHIFVVQRANTPSLVRC